MKNKVIVLTVLAAALALIGARSVRAGSPPAPATSGSVSGVVKFAGTAPHSVHVNMAADPTCMKTHPTGVTTEDVVVDGSGGLKDVIVFVAEGLGDQKFDPPVQPAVIEQKGCMYEPHVVVMQANQKLEVVNDDKTTHNIHPIPVNNREWNKSQPPGTPVEETFAREEIAIPVKCNVHPWMKSYIAVIKNPYFAVTGKDGSFDLKGLPPGTYTIAAWHEKLGTSRQTVTVSGSETKSLQFVFKGAS
jgi:hypothetical protein